MYYVILACFCYFSNTFFNYNVYCVIYHAFVKLFISVVVCALFICFVSIFMEGLCAFLEMTLRGKYVLNYY